VIFNHIVECVFMAAFLVNARAVFPGGEAGSGRWLSFRVIMAFLSICAGAALFLVVR